MNYNVLITDDTAINRKLVRSVLKSMPDINFWEAEDGNRCLELLNELTIDLLILDLMMPNKDGFEVLQEMEKKDLLKDIPVIVFSAMDSFDSLARAFLLGACDYFTKPLTPQQMKVILPMKVKYHLESYANKRHIIQHNKQMKLEMSLAQLFQQQLMSSFKIFDQANMYGRYLPCSEIGGDFYDCVEREGGICFIIADVSGHGVAAAMLSSMIKVEFENCARTMESPADMLTHMNDVFLPITSGNYYFTAFLGILEDGKVTYANAGHPYPVLYNASSKQTSIVHQDGFAIGMIEEASFADHVLIMNSGDLLMTYTDGLVEDHMTDIGNRAQTYEELANFLSSYSSLLHEEPDQFFDIMRQLFTDQANVEANDDIAIMVIEMK